MRELTDLYESASRFRHLASDCERAFADGLRVADGVRRAARQGHRDRPDASDCEALAVPVRRLQEMLRDLEGSASLGDFRRAIAGGEAARAAQLACEVFAGLKPADPPPEAGYRGLAVRERGRRGEGIIHHDALAARLAMEIEGGLSPALARTGDGERSLSIADLPEPIALSPSFDGCGSEVALRIGLERSDVPVLLQEQTGDLWIFRPRLAGPLSVVLAREADDEWWAASPVPYAAYATALEGALASRSIAVIRL